MNEGSKIEDLSRWVGNSGLLFSNIKKNPRGNKQIGLSILLYSIDLHVLTFLIPPIEV